MRVILHAGFHKTGTTTVQKTLSRNRVLLKPHLRVYLRPGMVGLCEAARAWSVNRGQMDLGLLRYEMAALADGWARDDPRPVLLASEDLAGHMPGRRGLTTYDAAPKIMGVLAETLAEVHPEAELAFYFSTRRAVPWLASCHVQHLRATRMTLDVDEYADAYRASANLGGVVDEVRKAVENRPVHSCLLEDCADSCHGPLSPVLDLAGLAEDIREQIVLLPPANTAPSQAKLQRLLELNRSNLSDTALREAKQALNREMS